MSDLFANTGADKREAIIWLSVNAKEGQLYRHAKGEKTPIKNFSGYIRSIKVEWDEGNPSKRIKPHHNYVIDLIAKDTDKKIKVFRIRFNQSVSLTRNLWNALAAKTTATHAEHRWIFFSVYLKDGEETANIYIEDSPRNRAAVKYEWDEETRFLKGVPIPVNWGNPDKEKDYTETHAFMLREMNERIAPMFNAVCLELENSLDVAPAETEELESEFTPAEDSFTIDELHSTVPEEVSNKSADFLNKATNAGEVVERWAKFVAWAKSLGATPQDITTIMKDWQQVIDSLKGEGENYLLLATGQFDESDDDLPF